MVRVLVRETVLTVFALLVASVLGFVVLDATGRHDWYGTREGGARMGMTERESLLAGLPRLWNPRVVDAEVRTLDDVARLATPADALAREQLGARGTVVLPIVLPRLRELPIERRRALLGVLAPLARTVGAGATPPAGDEAATEWWERFDVLHGLDFRAVFARRLALRLADHESRNARDALLHVGTFALPAILETLAAERDPGARIRLAQVAADLTGERVRPAVDAPASDVAVDTAAWRAWWSAHRLEYRTLGATGRTLGHALETRYGQWLTALVRGTLGPSRVTGRGVADEWRLRLPVSLFVAGLGGLLATALVVAFGGGEALRGRPLGIKFLDLFGALVPGLAAFLVAFVVVAGACSAGRDEDVRTFLAAHFVRASLGTILLAAPTVLLLRTPRARLVLGAVRAEAESWALESRDPHWRQLLRHGGRVGLASLLVPPGMAALGLAATTIVIEPLLGIPGLGALTLASLRVWDAPWLLVALVSAVPLVLGGRWSRRLLAWALGDQVPAVRNSLVPSRPPRN